MPHVRLSEIMHEGQLAGLARLPWPLGKYVRFCCYVDPIWVAKDAGCEANTCAMSNEQHCQ